MASLSIILAFAMVGGACSGTRTSRGALDAERTRQNQADVAAARDIAAGVAKLDEGKHEEAVAALRRAAERNPRSAEAWTALGVALDASERYYEAAVALDRAIRLAPTRYEPLFNQGQVFEATGQYANAIQAYESALRLAPDQVQVMENLARTYVQANREPERALQLIVRCLEVEQRPEWRAWLTQHAERLLEASRASRRSEPQGTTP